MYAIASLLDPSADTIVRSIWERFEVHCGLSGIRSTPLPHFSWQGAEAYQVESVEAEMFRAARMFKPFTVIASGVAMFTGIRPVIYIAVAKNQSMAAIHQVLWERTQPHAAGMNGYYSPDRWIPHITLAIRELDADRLACAVEVIAFEKIEFEVRVDNLALIYTVNGQAGLHKRVALAEGRQEEEKKNEYTAVSSRLAS